MANSLQNAFIRVRDNQTWSWSFRLAITVCVPLVVCLLLNNLREAFWIILSAQSLGYIEIKGTFGNFFRNIVLAIFLSVSFCIIGTVSGSIFIIHLILMFIVGFISVMFKNLGERGTGVALSIYIFYIFTSSYPTQDLEEIWHRTFYVFIGSSWSALVAVCFMLLPKSGLGFRRSMGDVFQEMSVITSKARSGFGGEGLFVSVRELYVQEVKIRKALNLSIELYSTSSQSDTKEINEKQVQYLRKIAGLLNIQLIEIIEKTQLLKKYRKEANIDLNIHSILRVWEQIFLFMEKYLISLSSQDKVMLETRIQRLQNLTSIIQKDYQYITPEAKNAIEYLLHLSGRMAKIVERFMSLIDVQNDKSLYKAYSLTYTLSLLHPKLFSYEWKNFFKLDTEMTKYAMRVGIAVSIGYILDYTVFPEFGYWIPFTSIIVAQPYVGATIRKGVERTIGTLLGVVVGYFILELPHGQIWNLAILFFSSIFSIYFLKKQYSISTFFVTLSMIGIISLSHRSQEGILYVRIISTVVGAGISILLAFMFISSWDKSLLPIHMKEALKKNFIYFLTSPFHHTHQEHQNWLRNKRISESSNATLYDSFSRWMTEPSIRRDKKKIPIYFSKITHIIRITKEINNLNTEHELMDNTNADQYIYIDTDNQKLKMIIDLFQTCFEQFGIEKLNINEYVDFQKINYYNKIQLISLDKIIIELRAIIHSKKVN